MATKRKTNPQDNAARQLLKRLCEALDNKKAEDLVVLDVSQQSSITNYLIIATGTSDPHLRALRNELHQVIKETNTHVLGVDSGDGSGWTVVDAFDVMVHVLTPENRQRYRLETLWGDATPVNWKRVGTATEDSAAKSDESAAPKPKPARKSAAAKKKTAPKKAAAVPKKAAKKSSR